MPGTRLTLDSGPLSQATSTLERTARLYSQIADSHAKLMRQDPGAGLQAAGVHGVSVARGRRAAEKEFDQFLAGLNREAVQQGRAADRAAGPSFGSRLGTAIRSTRFGAGPASPLVGRTMDVFAPGMGTAAGPVGIAVTAAAAAITAFVAVVRSATDTLASFRQATMESGGTVGQVAGLRAMGLSGQDIVSRGAGLRGAATGGDPFAMMRAMSAGVSILPGELGNQNQAQQLQGAIGYLRVLGQTRGAEEQLRAARSLNMEWALREANASDRVWQAWQKDAEVAKSVFDPAVTQAAADLQQQFARVQDNWQTLIAALGAPVIADAAEAFGDIADALRGVVGIAGSGAAGFGVSVGVQAAVAQIPGIGNIIAGLMAQHMIERAGGVGGPGSKAEAQTTALGDNTDAIRQLISVMTSRRREVMGGGERAAGILPGGLIGAEIMKAIAARRFVLGAFRA